LQTKGSQTRTHARTKVVMYGVAVGVSREEGSAGRARSNLRKLGEGETWKERVVAQELVQADAAYY
jgi:hypothetical protein